MGEIGTLRVGLQFGEGARHAGEAELVHLVNGLMGQHDQASSMVVAGAADVGVVGQQLVLPGRSGRLLVEPMLEDRLDRSVGPGADVETIRRNADGNWACARRWSYAGCDPRRVDARQPARLCGTARPCGR